MLMIDVSMGVSMGVSMSVCQYIFNSHSYVLQLVMTESVAANDVGILDGM